MIPGSEGRPRQDLLAALAFLDAVDGKVAAAERERFEQLRDQVPSADGGQGLPEVLLPARPGSRDRRRARASGDQLRVAYVRDLAQRRVDQSGRGRGTVGTSS